jgi:hypothetical protein
MLRKLVPFLSVILFAGPVFAADVPPFAHHSHASSANASASGRHRHHSRHRHHHRSHSH